MKIFPTNNFLWAFTHCSKFYLHVVIEWQITHVFWNGRRICDWGTRNLCISPSLVSLYLDGLVKVLLNMLEVALYQCFLNLSMHQNHLQSFLKHIALPTPGVSDSVSLGWGLRIFISNKFPGKVSQLIQETTALHHSGSPSISSIIFKLPEKAS